MDDYNRWVYRRHLLLPEDGGDGASLILLVLMRNDRKVWIHVTHLQAGAWSETITSDLIEVPEKPLEHCRKPNKFCFLANRKVYMLCMSGYILGFDLPSPALFYVKLPHGVELSMSMGIKQTLGCAPELRPLEFISSMLRSFRFMFGSTVRITAALVIGCWLIQFVCIRRLVILQNLPGSQRVLLSMWLQLGTMLTLCSC
uniref:F-box protein AT5G49610-like beta-propeller domain-containing protein n=1 Tax=Arundo donax TaxID=35708 RepID=A0A0A9TMF6_ARUDO